MDLCVTDPPYNVNYVGGTADAMTIANDDMSETEFYTFLRDFYVQMMNALKPGGGYYIFHADSAGLIFRAALQEAGGRVKQNLIWVKNSLVLGRQDYQWRHEPILYGWKDGAAHYFVNDRCQTTVFENVTDPESMTREELVKLATHLLLEREHLRSSVIRENKPTRNDLHPTMKPIPLCAKLIQNSSKRGDNVIDFFGGSGSTLMACEETGRNCFTIELDPRYADVIISRWEEATGERAVLLNGAE
jgi:site-specific DNA-methyltransferase (adenine-specific)